VLETNDNQSREVLALLRRHFPVFTDLRVAVLGLAFKPGTDDIRESPALRVIPSLAADGAQVIAYDPLANEQTRRVLGDLRIQYAESLAAAVQAVDAIIVLTAWPEFQQLPELIERAESPAVVVDGRRAIDKARVRRYEGIGLGGTWERPTLAGAHLGV
jgi:UDPglucose 6-dehydrogenase/GDP-mannose 6-dehydrogenase